MSNEVILKRVNFDFPVKLKGDGRVHVSAEVVLGDIPWKIKIYERKDGNEMVIDAALICSPPENSENLEWICEAMATVSVPSFNSSRKMNEINIPKTLFEAGCLSSRAIEIMRGATLEQYKQNNCITFDVQLLANPTFYQTSGDADHIMSAKFRFGIDNVSAIISGVGIKSSADIKVCGTIWNVRVGREKNHLCIYLNDKRIPRNVNWSWNVECSFTLVSFEKGAQPISMRLRHDFHSGSQIWGYGEFLEWEKFMDPTKGYVRMDKAFVEVDLKVDPPKPLWNFEQEPIKTNNLDCSICLQDITQRSPTSTKCGHLFCNACIRRSVQKYQKCPNCNATTTLNDIHPVFF